MVCVGVLVLAAGILLRTYCDESRANESFAALSKEVLAASELDSEDSLRAGGRTAVLQRYAGLVRENSDLAGWIAVPGTSVDYPVMQSQEEPHFYLYRDFYRDKSDFGTPHTTATCTDLSDCTNVIVYGHNIDNSQMFGALIEYKQEDFFREHKIIAFDSLSTTRTYEVFAVITTSLADPKHLAFYQHANIETQAQYAEFVSEAIGESLYVAEVVPTYGDSLLTLVTCDDSVESGRLVIVAKQI